MFAPGAKHHKAALALDDLASALDAGLPIESLGGNVDLEDHVLLDLAWQRGITLTASEKIVLEAAWKSGNAGKALRGRAADRRRQAEFYEEIWAGLRYPVILLCMLPVVAVATYAVIGPDFAIALAIAYGILAIVYLIMARKLGRGDANLERFPIIGSLLEDVRELPYLESLHAQYGAGVPIVEAHGAAIRSVKMRALRERLGQTQQYLSEGIELREALHRSGALCQETRSLLATGEQAGQLEDALERALTRRREVAGRKMATAARRIGQIAYALAVVAIVYVVFKFYSSYFAMMGL